MSNADNAKDAEDMITGTGTGTRTAGLSVNQFKGLNHILGRERVES
jgi:hypothetical protein